MMVWRWLLVHGTPSSGYGIKLNAGRIILELSPRMRVYKVASYHAIVHAQHILSNTLNYQDMLCCISLVWFLLLMASLQTR